MQSDQTFKKCPGCGAWFSLEDIHHSPEVRPIGLAIDPEDSHHCYLHFVHDHTGCGSSFLVHSKDLLQMPGIPVRDQSCFGGPQCSGLCTHLEELAACDAPCRLSAFRELILRLQGWREPEPTA